MRIDLHTHSSRSDGTDAPADLVAAASRSGLDVVALTDHDTTSGWDEAVESAEQHAISLVRGIELSTRRDGRSVHLLAYLPDPGFPELVEELRRIRGSRQDRLATMVNGLAEAGIEITEDDVRRHAGEDVVLGRPHVADALVEKGVVTDRNQAFAQWLSPGMPGYAPRYAPDVADAVDLVRRAGGAPVLAHPWARETGGVLSHEVIADLTRRGLVGLEVEHQDHDAAARSGLRGLADELGLVRTGSSDYHGLGKVDHDLGCNCTEPEQLERLLDLASRNAHEAGVAAPELLRG